MAKTPEIYIRPQTIQESLRRFIRQGVDPDNIVTIAQELAAIDEDQKFGKTVTRLKRIYGDDNVHQPQQGYALVQRNDGKLNFFDEHQKPISPSWFEDAQDFEIVDGQPQATVWIGFNRPDFKNPDKSTDHQTLEIKHINQSGEFIPFTSDPEISLVLNRKISTKSTQNTVNRVRRVHFKKEIQLSSEKKYPGQIYNLWGDTEKTNILKKTDSIITLVEKSHEYRVAAKKRREKLNQGKATPTEEKYTGPVSNVTGRIYLDCNYCAGEEDVIKRLNELSSQRAPNMRAETNFSLYDFSKKDYYNQEEIKKTRGIVLFPSRMTFIDDGPYEGNFGVQISSTYLNIIIELAHKLKVPLLLMPDYPANSDLYNQTITDFVKRAIKTPIPDTDFI